MIKIVFGLGAILGPKIERNMKKHSSEEFEEFEEFKEFKEFKGFAQGAGEGGVVRVSSQDAGVWGEGGVIRVGM